LFFLSFFEQNFFQPPEKFYFFYQVVWCFFLNWIKISEWFEKSQNTLSLKRKKPAKTLA